MGKELREYLPHDEHWKLKSDRKSVEKVTNPTTATSLPASVSPNSDAAPADAAPAEGTASEERKRSLSMMDTEAATPPPYQSPLTCVCVEIHDGSLRKKK